MACLYLKGCTGDLVKLFILYIVLPFMILVASAYCLPCKIASCLARVAKRKLEHQETSSEDRENNQKPDNDTIDK